MSKKKKTKAVSIGSDVNKKFIDTLLIEGTFFAPSGYSSSTREFTHHFIKNFGDQFKNIYLIDRQWDQIKMVLHPKYKDTIMKHVVKDKNDIKDVVPDNSMILRWGIPTGFDYTGFNDVPHRIKALYFVWECDRIPPLWIDLLMYYDVIFTCSVASKKAIELSLRERGSEIPVTIIPHGVAEHYTKLDRPKTLDGFTFMTIGTYSKRKAPLEMIKAFITEFSSEEPVRMVWKIGGIANPAQMLVLRREIQRMAFQLKRDMNVAPKVILDMNTYDPYLMNDLYHEADCMVQVSHGEAWGLPILNAMATGTPSLTLEKGGHRSYTTKETTFFVKAGELIYADGNNDWYASVNGVKWWSIDIADYPTKLRYVYEHREEIEEKGEAGLAVAKRFSWDNVVKKANKIFKKLNNQLPSRYERST